MVWYDPIIITFAVIGILMMAFSSHHNKHMMHWGLTLLLLSLVAKAFLWFESLI
ncbi:MAG: hypothetical protein Q8P79_01655 [Nanoarchaeota archaeon]|nr:hypothetical protein [Nanoarchaeota archaeon]